MVESVQNLSIKCVGGVWQEVVSDVPKPGKGQVLIKNAYSTCNPSDQYTVEFRVEGNILGGDGCGVILQVGEEVPASLVGKKVAFTGQAYQRYKLHSIYSLILLDDSQDLTKAANAFINPMTAIAQVELVRKKGSKSAIVTAASSSLAKQYFKHAQAEGFETINIVRKDEQVKNLQEELGAKYVLNQTSPTFMADLDEMIKILEPTVLFEYCGGDLSGKILERMAPYSYMYIVGNLSFTPIVLSSGDMIFKQKQAKGLYLPGWLKKEGVNAAKHFQKISEDLRDGGKIFGSKTAKTIKLSQWQEGLKEYTQVATEGKILLEIE